MATPALSAIRGRGLRRMDYRGIVNAREVMMMPARMDVKMPLCVAPIGIIHYSGAMSLGGAIRFLGIRWIGESCSKDRRYLMQARFYSLSDKR